MHDARTTTVVADHTVRSIVDQLRTAGCVFAEEEAGILINASSNTDDLTVMCRRRVAGEPLEHIVGWVEFGALRLAVGPGVFVPRQRSRLIADIAVSALQSCTSAIFVETFAGVAPIAASVQQSISSALVHAVDVDDVATTYARRNLAFNGNVHRGDVLSGLPDDMRGRVGAIAAVPPYAPTTAADLLSREARDFEPETALFGGTDGLDHIRRLCTEAPAWLARGGRLLIEMNKRQFPDAARHAEAVGFYVGRRRGDDGQTVILILQRQPRLVL